MSVDKTKSVFLMDSLEVIDRSPEAEQEGRYLHHDLFSPYLLKQVQHPSGLVLKYAGNIVIPGKHVISIKIDKRFNEIYDKEEAKLKEQHQRKMEDIS